MSQAYKCDHCGEFKEGEAHISVKMTFTSDDAGFLGKLFGVGNGRNTVEFCSLTCLESFSFDDRRDRMIDEYDRKDELLPDSEFTVSNQE